MKERTEQNKRLIAVLKKNEEFLNIRGIERELGMANGTISKVMEGKRGLASNNEVRIIAFIKHMTNDFESIVVDKTKSSSWVRRLYEQACALLRSSRSNRSQ